MPCLNMEEIRGLSRTLILYILLPESYYLDIKIAEKNNDEGNAMFKKLIKIKNDLYRYQQ